MATKKQIEANQKNALKSTGPKTPGGKAIVGRNAVKHGLYSKEVVLKGGLIGENANEFEELLQGLIADLRPVGTMETILVEKIAASSWRFKRLFRAECGSIQTNIVNVDKENQYVAGMSPCPIGIHKLLGDENVSIEDCTSEMMKYAKKLDQSGDAILKDEDFIELFEEKYPDQKLEDLSIHQLKRLKSTFRSEIKAKMLEKAHLVNYLQKAKPQHLDCLIPDDKITKYGITLERSILKDLSALKQLQAMRKQD
ncbi:MAG: hypothetical protein GY841_23870 [FCB group bacterium]|nr:hypothetical protein [FCB group bacterium]